jgi:hypothetical protein
MKAMQKLNKKSQNFLGSEFLKMLFLHFTILLQIHISNIILFGKNNKLQKDVRYR